MISMPLKKDIIDHARSWIASTKVHRTVASHNDTLIGNIGELVFADYLYGDWQKHHLGANKGQEDFPKIEIKTSVHKYRPNLHLLVREDYAEKRSPATYVQLLIDLEAKEDIVEGSMIHIVGHATHAQVIQKKPKDFGCSFKKQAGYKCYFVPFKELSPMDDFKERYIYLLTSLLKEK